MPDNPYMATNNPYMKLGTQTSNPYMDLKEQRKPTSEMAGDMMSQIVGLDRPQPAPLKETHPNLWAAGKTALDMPGLIEKGAMAIISGATWSLPERAEEAGEYLSRKLFGEGRKGGATGSWEEEPELHPYVKGGLKFVGQAINIKTLGKVVAAPAIKFVLGSKYFAPFANMIGWGAAGSAYTVGEQLFEEGELPTPKEIAESGATWAAIEGVMSGLGWTGKLAVGLNRLSKTWTIPRKEVLKIVIAEAKLRKMPLAKYIFTKAKVQKALGVKEKLAAEQLLNVVDDAIKPFRKQGTCQSLVEQLKTEEIAGRIKSFKKHVGETIIIGKKSKPGMVTAKKASDIEKALLKPGFKRTAEDIALINSTKPGLILPVPKTPPKPMKAFPKPTKEALAKIEQLKIEKLIAPIKSFRKPVGETVILGKKVKPGTITAKRTGDIEKALLKAPHTRTAEEVMLINRTKANLKLPAQKVIPKPTKAFPTPAKVVAPPTKESLAAIEHAKTIKKGYRQGRILTEDIPKWARETEGKIRFGESVTKAEILKYQKYFKIKRKIAKGIVPANHVYPQLPKNIPVKKTWESELTYYSGGSNLESKTGIYFTPNKKLAESFAKNRGAFRETKFGKFDISKKSTKLITTKLDIKNPKKVAKEGFEVPETSNLTKNKIADLKKQGYDSMILYENGKIGEVVVFDKSQIKSLAVKLPVKPRPKVKTKLPPGEQKAKPGLRAALVYPNGKMITGRSHLKCLEEAERQGLDVLATGSAKPIKEGFVTSAGKFITRQEAIQKFGTGESFRLQEVGIIATKKQGTTFGFGPTAYLQNTYDKIAARRLHKKFKKKLGDSAKHILSPTASKVMKAIKAAKPIRGKQEAIYAIGRAKKLARAMAVGKRTAGERGYHAELAALEGPMGVAKYRSVRSVINQDEVNILMDEIKNSPVLSYFEKFPCRKGLAKMLSGVVPTEGELRFLEDVFGPKFVGTVLQKRDLFKRLTELGIQAINFTKAIKSSYDLSAPLRQGVFMIRRYKQWLPAFRDQFKYFGDKQAFMDSQTAIRRHKNYKLAIKNGLVLTDLKKGLTNREEAFQAPWAEKIPGVGASSQAYTGFLNQFRFSVFNNFVEKGRQLGLTKDPRYLKSAAKYINHGTGRGHLLGLEGAAVELNTTFFSPRLIMSRLQLVNPVFYVRLEKHVRKEALKDLFAFAGITMSIGGLAKMAGLDVEVDPRSADFMKIRAGSKRYDVMGGIQQVVKTTAQFLSGEVKSSTTGEVLTLGEGYKPLTRLGIVSRFLQYKLSPVASFSVSLLTGQATMGGKVDVPTEIGRLFVPMAAEDMREIYDEEGLKGIPMAFPAFFGVGLQSYGGVTSYGLKGKDYPLLNKELTRLKTSMGFPSTAVYGKELSSKEYRRFKTESGKAIAEELTNMLDKAFYKDVNDDAKRHIIDKTIDFNKEYVKRGMFPRYRLIQEQATKIRAATYVNVRKSREQAKKMLEKLESGK